jgi:predicted acylesterase/phospholipase RssA
MEVGMAHPARTALVLQGGGALGAYELGAARRLYKDDAFAPDVIAGVSIGAISAVLLARPATGLKPLEALEAFWQKITVSGLFLPRPFRPYASVLGNPNFFVPRLDYYALRPGPIFTTRSRSARRCPNWSTSRLLRIRRPRRDCW